MDGAVLHTYTVSRRYVIRSAGRLLAHYEYDPYGGVTAQAGTYAAANPVRFSTTYWDDETGLGYWGYRYYSPALGRWISRDPISERGGPNIYAYVRNRALNRVDPLGLMWLVQSQPCCDYCGPDVTKFVALLVNSAMAWRASIPSTSRFDSIRWMYNNAGNLDWWSTTGPYNVKDDKGAMLCPTRGKCMHTYWLCGECVHDHWIGNFMFGFLGRLFELPDFVMNAAASYVQQPFVDPPWDTAGYDLARRLHDAILTNPSAKVTADSLCRILKSDQALWNQANNTSVTGPGYPVPHAKDYKDCKKCPHALPGTVMFTLPGGKFGSNWPAYP